MSEAPETIWAWPNTKDNRGWYAAECSNEPTLVYADVEYRSADLPATDEQAFANEKVKALVEAAAQALIENDGGGLTEDTSDRINVALAEMEIDYD